MEACPQCSLFHVPKHGTRTGLRPCADVDPRTNRTEASTALTAYCAKRVPQHVRDQLRLTHTIEGNAVTLIEHRPHWQDTSAPWTAMHIARIRWDSATATWSLDWPDSDGRWLELEDAPPVGHIRIALEIIDDNPNGCFWG